MTLEEIKAAIVERIDAAWNEVKDQTNADAVRTYVQGLTAELTSHVYSVEAALVNHVLGKQETSTPAPSAPAAPVEPTASTEQPTPDAAPAPAVETAAPASSTPDSSTQVNPTGMAANPEPTPVAEPAAASTPEPTQ